MTHTCEKCQKPFAFASLLERHMQNKRPCERVEAALVVEEPKQRKPVSQAVEFPPDYADWDANKQARWNFSNIVAYGMNLSFVIPNKKQDKIYYATSNGAAFCSVDMFYRIIRERFPGVITMNNCIQAFFDLMDPTEKRALYNKILKRDMNLNYWMKAES